MGSPLTPKINRGGLNPKCSRLLLEAQILVWAPCKLSLLIEHIHVYVSDNKYVWIWRPSAEFRCPFVPFWQRKSTGGSLSPRVPGFTKLHSSFFVRKYNTTTLDTVIYIFIMSLLHNINVHAYTVRTMLSALVQLKYRVSTWYIHWKPN